MNRKPSNSTQSRGNINEPGEDFPSQVIDDLPAAYAEMTTDRDREAEAEEWLSEASGKSPFRQGEDEAWESSNL
jgi:hypothetical protein